MVSAPEPGAAGGVASVDAIADPVLRRFAERVSADPGGARADLLAALRAAKGPLLQAESDGTVRVTFVAVGPAEAPVLRCALLGGLESTVTLRPVPAVADVWWTDLLADDDTSVAYQFQTRPVPMPSGDDGPVHDPEVMRRFVAELAETGYADPFNPDSYPFQEAAEVAVRDEAAPPEGFPDPGTAPWESALTLPGAAPFRWHRPAPADGRLTVRRFGSDILGNTRSLAVWTPLPTADADLPVVILLDGEAMHGRRMRIERIFANLVEAGVVPPFAGVLVHNASEMSRMREYPCHPPFAAFLADELLPVLRADLPLSDDPADVVVGGFSYGGLAADFVALTRPDAFGAALSMSASLWWGIRPPEPSDGDDSLGRDNDPEWLTRQVGPAPANAARFWIDVGRLEDAPLPFARGVSQLSANRTFRDTLLRNGYRVAGYREQPGGHDLFNWRRTLPDGLIALLGARPDAPGDAYRTTGTAAAGYRAGMGDLVAGDTGG